MDSKALKTLETLEDQESEFPPFAKNAKDGAPRVCRRRQKPASRACPEPVEGSTRSTRASRDIIVHGELAPTDCDHRSYPDQVPRSDEADAGEPSAGRSHDRQKGLRLFP